MSHDPPIEINALLEYLLILLALYRSIHAHMYAYACTHARTHTSYMD